jgi:hypothetical protein
MPCTGRGDWTGAQRMPGLPALPLALASGQDTCDTERLSILMVHKSPISGSGVGRQPHRPGSHEANVGGHGTSYTAAEHPRGRRAAVRDICGMVSAQPSESMCIPAGHAITSHLTNDRLKPSAQSTLFTYVLSNEVPSCPRPRAFVPPRLSVAMRKWLWPTFRDGTSPACRVAW